MNEFHITTGWLMRWVNSGGKNALGKLQIIDVRNVLSKGMFFGTHFEIPAQTNM
jgi:hypothetical protein